MESTEPCGLDCGYLPVELLSQRLLPSRRAPLTGAQAALGCEEWNTKEFFERARAETITACLGAGVDVAATDDDRMTPPALGGGL